MNTPRRFKDLSPIEKSEYIKAYGAPPKECLNCSQMAMPNSEFCLQCAREEAGNCIKCGEPINNAEYTICRQCAAAAREYQQDVEDEQKKGGWA